MKKAYVVIADFGSWDSHHTKAIKVFAKMDDAMEYAEKYYKVFTKVKMYVSKAYRLIDEDCGSEIVSTIFDQAMWAKYRKYQEFNECVIKELDYIE